jgi:enoyl-CoA hydratase/carnithine racemase
VQFAAACDVRVGSSNAVIGLPAARRRVRPREAAAASKRLMALSEDAPGASGA